MIIVDAILIILLSFTAGVDVGEGNMGWFVLVRLALAIGLIILMVGSTC